MKILELSSIPPAEWNKVYESSGDAWLFHSHEWVEIEARYFAQKNLSFGVQDEQGKTICIHPLYLRQNGMGTWVEKSIDCGIHRHTGIAMLDDLSSTVIHSLRAFALQHIFTLAEMNDIDRIQLNSHNLAPKNLSPLREEIPYWVADYHFYLGLCFGPQGFNPVPGMATCCADQIVNIGESSEDQIFRKFEESCQRAVRKAIRNNLILDTNENENSVSDYYALAQLSRERTGENAPPLEYYQYLFTKLYPLNKCKILFARKGGKKIGALFLLMDKQSVNFMAGVSHPEFLPLRVNDFLHWSAIQWAKETGYQYYRLGPIFPELPQDWPIARVSRFKKKFGGRNVPTIQGSFFLRPERYMEKGREEIGNLLRGLKGGTPVPEKEAKE